MPRDIRSITPAFETLRFVAAVCIGRTSKQTKRDFAGYAVGKRRKLSVVPYIAGDMAKELIRSVQVANGNQRVTAEEIAGKIEAILLGLDEKTAFNLASIATEEREAVVDLIADQVRAMMLTDYTVSEVEKEPEPPKPVEWNGWQSFESIKAAEKPQYKWRHTWADRCGNDFVGYKDGKCIGRVFQIDYTAQRDRWFWLIEHVPVERPARENRSAGWEWTAREAACRAEKCYDAIMRLNGKQA
ncbi:MULTISPECIES: hypothetical protein [Rhizobium]|uniref:Uncharacterized protein n=1 Tax=Rhizobium tropici TaxID=398 RepID=A0A6P1CBP7_RHITR|nr:MULTISPECIES: hypothetical protein [Rhizobium]AGB71793.1 hypothetical protein RTCIAT899_CH12060 [Rhizobium tropici CIAT 899]MBB4245078.1 hypothetical protein [Rhizobium tropici]MBB5596441.1 hypothetical protein [Rhizobium tropici]MBB6495468.1 hypothetical protein [Rhizobium tropici]NEV14488.1 hypothetical protein [Rhizobium tropici]